MRALLLVIVVGVLCPVLSLDSNWRLLWSDEFSGTEIDTTKWNLRDQAGNVGNGETQYYSPSQISVSGGNLVITANDVATEGFSYVSGWVDTQNKFYTTYGRYEFRAQMAGGDGMWPALWLLSQLYCWPLGAEFDIMEFRGSDPNYANGYYHYGSGCASPEASFGDSAYSSTSYAEGFHVYALEWSPSSAVWYVDDVPFLITNQSQLQTGYTQTPQVYDPTPHYIIMNVAMGGGYAGNPDSTAEFPATLLVDYVRVYHKRSTCAGETCSNNGCCDPNSLLCVCNAGWNGYTCEQSMGSFVDKFVSTNVQYTPATDIKVNGWGNGYSFFSDSNVAISNGLTLTLTNTNCVANAANCAGLSYSAGAWNSAQYFSYGTFTFIAQGPSVSGTGFSLQAAGQSSEIMEQISFLLEGAYRNSAQLISWHLDYEYVQETVNLAFDHSAAEHNYTFVYAPEFIQYYIDGVLLLTTDVVVPNGTLQMGVYYAAQPQWYSGTFTYTGPTTTKVALASWSVTPATAKCSAPTPAPSCQPSPIGTGTGLTGDYFDNDSGSSYFVTYVMTTVDPTINFNWGSGSPTGVAVDNFSVRWTGQVQPLYSGVYTFYSTSDDGVRLYVNGVLIIDAWVVEAATEHSGTITLVGGTKYDIILEYEETTGDAVQILSWSSPCLPKQIIPQSQLYPCHSSKNSAGNGLTGKYYSDQNLATLVHTEIDPNVNYNWGNGGPAALNGQVDHFSIAWSGYVQPRYSGAYTFYADSDDGSRLYVNGQELVNDWNDQSLTENYGTINLVQGQNYSVVYQYYEDGGGAEAFMYWSNVCEAKQIIPTSQLFVS